MNLGIYPRHLRHPGPVLDGAWLATKSTIDRSTVRTVAAVRGLSGPVQSITSYESKGFI